ncbi:PucR family transcriptional regulator [Nocardia sp. BMG51109]|uniref:PucR family transcriptional regulator n=1 Tax=Nocardia sp. BMG51109 TaxID=1056816 RepID=UPI0004B590CE|nr:PucR family transcriptional regulator [Nocardia sp. BMG51109]
MQLSDVTALPGLASVRLIHGTEQLDRQVRWVYTTDLLDFRKYLAGGEIVLTSTTWRRRPEDSDYFVRALADGGAVALMAGTAMLGVMPPDLVRACALHRMPLFQVPDELSFGDIAEEVIGRLHEERGSALEQMVGRHRRLLSSFTRGDPLEAGTDLLRTELGFDSWTMSLTGRVLSGRCPYSAEVRAVAARHAVDAVRLPVYRQTPEGPVTLLAATPGGAPQAPTRLLACAADLRDWSQAERETVEEVAAFLGAWLARTDEGERQRREQLARLAALLDRDDTDPATVAAALTSAGLDPERPHQILRAQAGGEATGEWARQILTELIAEQAPDAVTAAVGTGAVAVIPRHPQAPAALDTSSLRHRLECLGPLLDGNSIGVGAGGIGAGAHALRRAWDQAEHALLVARQHPGGPSLVDIDEVDTFGMLLAATPDSLRSVFCDRVLGPVEEYDARGRTDLLDTLAAYLAASGSWHTVAAERHLHVNTLRYRIRRVEELTGRDLSQWRDRFDFQLALDLRRNRIGDRS